MISVLENYAPSMTTRSNSLLYKKEGKKKNHVHVYFIKLGIYLTIEIRLSHCPFVKSVWKIFNFYQIFYQNVLPELSNIEYLEFEMLSILENSKSWPI
jgi:hypothetical protein